jgi:DNA-binding NarL/FixJ family response regulator
MDEPVRLLVVGNDDLFAPGVRLLLGERADVSVLAVATDVDEASGICGARRPDVVLLDLDLRGLDGIAATGRILAACPSAKVLVVAELQSPAAIAASLSAGACGFVPRSPAPCDLAAVLRRAAAGEIVLPVAHLSDLVHRLEELNGGTGASSERDALTRLTARETEILAALARGASTDEVADRLRISRMTVQSHVKSILAKLEVHSKVEAVTLAWRHGLVSIVRTA